MNTDVKIACPIRTNAILVHLPCRCIHKIKHEIQPDKKLLIGRVPFVADIMLEMFVQVCEEDPFGVDMIVKSLKKKLDAQGNLKKIHEIVKQERMEVEELIAAHAL